MLRALEDIVAIGRRVKIQVLNTSRGFSKY
ncbi:hypothetical protein EYZ11_003637 [Aspergillus tanneri]|uniref:Uncharacterized protein n=1 Tax=Aspergillus tanneri TaxID=1220188 RepID=A0A4S3JPU5_9EURO|nr:hypothetical protein EYZ11_003637 [Aspergillus tanneri]